MDGLLDTPLGAIESCGVVSLIEELEMIAPVSAQALTQVTLWQFLTLCLYPSGLEGKRQPLSGRSLPDSALLNHTLRSLCREESAAFALCEEIARRNGTTVEFHLGERLANYLNRQLPRFEKRRGKR